MISWTPLRWATPVIAWTGLLLVAVLVELREEAGGVVWWVSVAGTVPVLVVPRHPLAGTALVFAPLWVLTLQGADAFSAGYLLAMVTAAYVAGLLSALPQAAAALGIGLVSAVASSLQAVQAGAGDVLFPTLLIAGPWAAGRVHRRWRERAVALRRLSDELARTRDDAARLAVAAERGEIARDLHDTLAQSLQVIIVNAEAAEAALQPADGLAREAVGRIGREARRALNVARETVSGLRDGRSPAAEPTAAGHPGFRELEAMIDTMRSTGLEIQVTVDSTVDELPPSLAATVYRMVQESLTNVVKHSAARRVSIEIRRRPRDLVIEVVDDGGVVDLEPAETAPSGFGIVGMRERVAALGGALEAGPVADGFRIHAVLPLTERPS